MMAFYYKVSLVTQFSPVLVPAGTRSHIPSLLKKSTTEPIRRKFDEVIFKEDEAWERSYSFNPHVFSLRGETGNSETRHYRWVYLK
jgi:hypothetical protein